MKFYAVAKGRKPGIYLSWADCEAQIKGYSGPKFKKFDSAEEAEEFYAKYNHGQLPRKRDYADAEYQAKRAVDEKYKHIDTCQVCGRPFKQQRGKNNSRRATPLCRTCKNRQYSRGTRSSIKNVTGGQIKSLSPDDLVFIKKKYGCDDPLSYAIKNPNVIFEVKQHDNTGLAQRELFRSRKQSQYIIVTEPAPQYVRRLLGEDKILISISGDKRDPRITFRCKRCEEDFTMQYKTLAKHKGHNSTALVSTGESVVQSYLTELGVRYLTQRATLKCINPETGYVMPYDFELPQNKIIIEVQGEQHRSFIERFHADMDGFEYQKWKDAHKKQFALQAGYTFIEIWYPDIETGRYKKIISSAIGRSSNVQESLLKEEPGGSPW